MIVYVVCNITDVRQIARNARHESGKNLKKRIQNTVTEIKPQGFCYSNQLSTLKRGHLVVFWPKYAG